MTHLTERNSIFIALLILYIPPLLTTILLCIRHGFFTGLYSFRPLLLFVIARFLGSVFEIAIITNPTDVNLYIASFVLLTIAISPLEWTTLALLNRILVKVNEKQQTMVKSWWIRGVGLVILIGLVLSIVGGVLSGQQYDNTGSYSADVYIKAALIIWLVTFVFIVLLAFFLCAYVHDLENVERGVLLAVVISLPLLLVRLVYSAIGLFSGLGSFNTLTGDTNILLGMALIEELVVVYLYCGVGLGLEKVEKKEATGSTTKQKGDVEMAGEA